MSANATAVEATVGRLRPPAGGTAASRGHSLGLRRAAGAGAGLEAALGRAGIRVVNLTSTLKARAERALASGEDIYLLDDIHGNARGTEIAATAIAEHLSCPDDALEP